MPLCMIIRNARSLVAILGCVFALGVVVSAPAGAVVEGADCDAEPTDMLVRYGDLINCAIDQIGDQDLFRFSGGTGETVRLQVAQLEGGTVCFQLFDPDGAPLHAGCRTAPADFILEQSGVHSIAFAQVNNFSTAQYALALERIDPPSPTAIPIDFGEVINNEINTAGDIDIFIFGGEASDTIRLQASRLEGGSSCFRLYGPDGAPLDIARCSNAARDYVLAQTGTHAIVMTASNNSQTVEHSLTLLCIAGVCPRVVFPEVAGCIALRGVALADRRVRLTQPGEDFQQVRTDVRGCYEFDDLVAEKNFRVKVFGPVVPEP